MDVDGFMLESSDSWLPNGPQGVLHISNTRHQTMDQELLYFRLPVSHCSCFEVKRDGQWWCRRGQGMSALM